MLARREAFLRWWMARVRGAGSLRQRKPGVWEVRVSLGPDAVSGRSRVRSLTVHGDVEVARERWAEAAVLVRSRRQVWSGITLAELLGVWLAAEHDWRPSTLVGYRSTAGFLARDPVGGRRAVDVGPQVLRAACARWRLGGSHDPTVWGRVRCLGSALRWAYAERILERDPLPSHGRVPDRNTRS